MVVDPSGVCIVGATVRVVRGQRVGSSATQAKPCDKWSAGGVAFSDLTPGVDMAVRAAAPGYVEQEQVIIPTVGEQHTNLFTLSQIQGE